MPDPADLAGLVETIAPQAIELRRRLHEHPEPAHREVATTQLIRAALESEGITFHDRGPKTGGWADVGGSTPAFGFRCDLDALPILEPADNRPRSRQRRVDACLWSRCPHGDRGRHRHRLEAHGT